MGKYLWRLWLVALMPVMTGACAGAAAENHADIKANWVPVPLERFEGTADYPYRLEHPSGYLSATGDFNGDGKADRAVFSEHRTSGALGLVAWLSNRAGGHDEILVHEYTQNNMARSAVVATPPGQHKTVCAKGYNFKECNITYITLRFDALDIFTFESASRIVYFDSGAFHEVWTSD